MIMSGYEEKLLARAEELDETSELASALGEIHAGAAAAGVDRQAVLRLEAAITVLGHGVPAYHPGGRGDRHPGSGYGSDVEFIEALAAAEEQIRDWLRAAVMLYAEVGTALERAQKDLEQARRDLAAAYAMSTHKPCNGCHAAKAAAIAAAEAAIEDAGRRIGICEHTGDILDALTERLRAALARVGQVPHDLGEVYELVAAFIQSGGVMPRFGRWVTGEPAGGAGTHPQSHAGDRARHDSGRAQPQPQPASPSARQGTATFSIVQADLTRKANQAIRDALRSQANGDDEQADRDFAAARAYRAEAAEYQP
jgi:hypothetical protein